MPGNGGDDPSVRRWSMPKQEFSLVDYLGAVVLGAIFILILFVLSLIMSWLCIRKTDEITTFEKIGARINLRMGPHRMSVVKKTLVAPQLAEDEC